VSGMKLYLFQKPLSFMLKQNLKNRIKFYFTCAKDFKNLQSVK